MAEQSSSVLRLAVVSSTLCLAALGCSNGPPVFEPIGDQTAFANAQLALTVRATDPDDDELSFGFTSDLGGVENRASMATTAPGTAIFRYTPLVSDVGIHAFDFTASDGTNEARTTVTVEVRPSEGATAPVFIQPLGSGTTLDLEVTSCVDVPIVVEDPDTAGVTLGQEEPLIEGATLTQDTELTGTWHFCPTAEQIAASDRYTLVLSADDFENPKTIKPYLVVLRTAAKPDCPGAAPVVDHTPEDVSSVVDLTIGAVVSDDLGIKYEPLLYYAFAPPGAPPDLAQMTQLTMLLIDGDMSSGTWAADVPNPVAAQPSGSTAQVYYAIVTQDNDDATGTCDHTTQAPATGTYQVTVTNPGGGGGLGLCAACSADAQCGGPDDHCVHLGDGYYCFEGCASDAECPADYYCSASSFTSIDGASARQCIPSSYSCQVASVCQDDSYEQNDTLAQVKNAAALPTGNFGNLVSCPLEPSGDDEDWYRISVAADSLVTLTLNGSAATDLDLALAKGDGTVVGKSDGLGSSETVSLCVPAGSYYVRVYAWGTAENHYTLSYAKTAQACTSCQDDGAEDDDDTLGARPVDLGAGTYHSTTNAICAGDEDWFEVYMYTGETLYSTLAFTQSNGQEDLDLLIYRNGVNLTGCSEQTPAGCDAANGQSGGSNETMTWPIAETGYYYLVVHGWNGSENLYDFCAGLTAGACP
ncbi:MAG: pre-peptidase C-terminal domain-containing protein [Myxococcales bacterium]|nr:pre-peptidase C-terminal domain-containing protein [Myxococcales bacterium]